MKLYHNGQAWQIPGQQDRKAEKVDVPTSPAPLAAWLNDRRVMPEPAAAYAFANLALEATGRGPLSDAEIEEEKVKPAPPRVPGHCDACGRSAVGALKLATGHDVDALEAWVEGIEHDNLWALGRAAEIIRDRARELGAQWAERTVQ